jgi:hypothetical protein
VAGYESKWDAKIAKGAKDAKKKKDVGGAACRLGTGRKLGRRGLFSWRSSRVLRAAFLCWRGRSVVGAVAEHASRFCPTGVDVG